MPIASPGASRPASRASSTSSISMPAPTSPSPTPRSASTSTRPYGRGILHHSGSVPYSNKILIFSKSKVTAAGSHAIQEVARVDQDGMGGRRAAVPEGFTGKCASFRSSTASLLHLLTQSRDTNEYGRFESKKYSEEKSSAKRKESQWPEKTSSAVRSCFWEEKIAASTAVIDGGG